MIDKVKAYKENGYNFKLILEHKETDIYNLLDKKIIKHKHRKHFSLENNNKTKIGHSKWHWMTDGRENYKVPENEVSDYLNRGFRLGHLKFKKK